MAMWRSNSSAALRCLRCPSANFLEGWSAPIRCPRRTAAAGCRHRRADFRPPSRAWKVCCPAMPARMAASIMSAPNAARRSSIQPATVGIAWRRVFVRIGHVPVLFCSGYPEQPKALRHKARSGCYGCSLCTRAGDIQMCARSAGACPCVRARRPGTPVTPGTSLYWCGFRVPGTRNTVPRTRNSQAAHALPSLVLLASANFATHSVSQRTAAVPGTCPFPAARHWRPEGRGWA